MNRKLSFVLAHGVWLIVLYFFKEPVIRVALSLYIGLFCLPISLCLFFFGLWVINEIDSFQELKEHIELWRLTFKIFIYTTVSFLIFLLCALITLK